MDGDESETHDSEAQDENGQNPQVKIPKSYLNKWVDIEPGDGIPIGITDQDTDRLSILQDESSMAGSDAVRNVRHPLFSALMSNILWHQKMRATEYVYSSSRTYTSQQITGIELIFLGPTNSRMAFGHTIETEGLSIQLESSLVMKIRDEITKAIMKGDRRWAATSLKFFIYHLGSIGMETGQASPYLVRDLVAVVSASMAAKGSTDWSPDSLVRELRELSEDSSKFTKLAEKYYRGTAFQEHNDTDSIRPETASDEKDQAQLNRNVSRLINIMNGLKEKLGEMSDKLTTWVASTLLNSFGTSASNALQRLAGVTEDVVGYTIDFRSISAGVFRIFLYDKDPLGSGSSDVARRFLHILHIQRHGDSIDSRLLPSDDFFTLLEEELLQCPQHHTDLSALEMLTQDQSKKKMDGLPILGYVYSQSVEVLENAKAAWKLLGIKGRDDAWKLPLLRMQTQVIASEELEVDDVTRATTICWNGCPECLLNPDAGSLVGETLLDKAILDEWFRQGRRRSEEYVEVDPVKLAGGKLNLPFGQLSRVVLDLQKRRVRSCSLPYTVGIEVPRDTVEEPRLIIRTSDIENFSLFETLKAKGPRMGIGSIGFRRLLMHDLVLTAFLDLLGLLPRERRKIQAVFYDCRDIPFEDVGVSSRMLDAIAEHARSLGLLLGNLEKLSDILIWFAKQNFDVSVCVDKSRLGEDGVKTFVDRLKQAKCTVASKELDPGLMHKKALVTPMSAIEGSANLTQGGTRINEEIVNYAQWGTQGYLEIQTSVRDTFQGSIILQ